ncbi:MAG: helix-turn-helix transcriptional regulator [Saprospiraceae bacterium]
MIREDRIELNERFVKVFKLLQERGDIIMNDRGGKGIGDFADKILGNRAYGHIVRAFLNPTDKRVIDYRHARLICQEYGVNESYLIDGLGTPFGIDLPETTHYNGAAENSTGNILYTSVQAFAGASVAADNTFSAEENAYFAIPGIRGDGLVAFPIEGNSMEPEIMNGDIVICREVRSTNEIKDNEIYAVKNNGSVNVKYVQRIYTKKGRLIELKLISANNLEHDPFSIEVNELTRLYKVTRKISQF